VEEATEPVTPTNRAEVNDAGSARYDEAEAKPDEAVLTRGQSLEGLLDR
jgi:hypothetical protein